jgi:osmotically-inducible protein OsmY
MPSFRRAGQTGVYAMKILVSFLLGLVFGAVVIYFVALSEVTADARITATIKARLIGEPNLSALKIDVDTDNGVVTLSGTVESAQQADRAVELARTVEGVTRVASVLQIDPD